MKITKIETFKVIDEEIDIGIYLRVNPQTSKLNGLMIIDFEKRFSHKKG